MGVIMWTKRCAMSLVCLLAVALTSHADAQDAAPGEPQTYFVIPIKGVIGRHFTAARMQAYLKDAERLKPTVIVLELDTAGGEINDAERIVDLIIAHKHLRFAAFVRKALSAGATITLACEKIFVAESATIGGAVSYSVGADGMPQSLPADVAEKFQSVWRAVCRKAAEHGGHPSLLAEAMVDPAFSLTMREEQGKLIFERDGQGKLLKAKGRILTLTAREAVDCKLAEAMVPGLHAVGQHLGMREWQELGGRPGVQPADVGSPEKTPLGAFAAPGSLYEMLYQKVVSLGLTGELTQIQKKKALEEWAAWFDAQRVKDRKVQWTVTLADASEGEVRFVPHTKKEERLIPDTTITYRTGELLLQDTTAKLGGSCRGPKMTLREFEKLLTATESSLKGAEEALARYRRTPDPYVRSNIPPAQKRVQALQEKVAYLRQIRRETEACPVKVTATYDSEPRVFHIAAWVSARWRDAITRVAPESELVLSGKIGEVVPYLSDDGVFLIEIILDECSVVEEKKLTAEAPEGGKDADRECRSLLSLARSYMGMKMPEKAIPFLKQVIEQYPDTDYAKEASELLQEVMPSAGSRADKDSSPSE